LSNTRPRVDWLNLSFMVAAHLLAVAAIAWTGWVRFSWWTVGLALLYFAFCGLSITGGYHRLYSHPTYKARPLLELFYLLFGAASVQNSALKWSSDHRLHHREVDREADPYNIKRGFFWAHMGWVLFKDRGLDLGNVPDLAANPRIQWQHRNYVLLAILIGAVLPLALGFLWRDPIGALLLAGFFRLVLQYHATFAVNSFAHYIGTQPYSDRNSARDSAVTAVLTLGEGYHNFHHHFQSDYRNGVRWFQLDPTKWFVWTLSRIGITSDLKRTSSEKIRAARAAMRGKLSRR
jgi:stearoyl-CoA desaturase (delta-9 desaturase)